MQLTRCGTALRSIVRPAGEAATRGVDAKLVSLISKAHDWFERLSSGRCDSMQAIAQEEQIASSSYVTRVIYLAFLAPDIVQRIVRGEQPVDLTADRLIRIEQAKHLLVTTRWPATRIAAETGFCDLPHMIRVFRIAEGTTPNTFRKMRGQGGS